MKQISLQWVKSPRRLSILSVGTRFGAWAEARLMPRQSAELGGCGVSSVQSLLLDELYMAAHFAGR
jgi:hypothetical protein